MTRSRYLAFRVAQAFGIRLTARHVGNAATELHLLREAEEILGGLCWRDLENFEDLSVEYWNLRKLDKEQVELSTQIASASDVLQQSHDQRAELLEKVVECTKDLVADRENLIEKSERLGAERELILREARAVKRRHDGLKAKLEVLTEEDGQLETINNTKSEISELKTRFGTLRTRRDELTERLKELDSSIKRIDEQIETLLRADAGEVSDRLAATVVVGGGGFEDVGGVGSQGGNMKFLGGLPEQACHLAGIVVAVDDEGIHLVGEFLHLC